MISTQKINNPHFLLQSYTGKYVMYYYELLPAERSYQGTKLLTYAADNRLQRGQVVVVKLRTISMHAIIIHEVPKPTFTVKNIHNVVQNIVISESGLSLLEWVSAYYPAGYGSVGSLFMPASIPKREQTAKISDVSTTIKKSSLPPLTNQQRDAIQKIELTKNGTHIIHGETGSGKTRIYIELARQCIAKNQSVLILTPEISLTPQMAEQFNGVFSNVIIVHSGLTVAQRRNLWASLSHTASRPVIVIGPRSGLFYPINKLGLIVVDEFHDSAYKQDQSPRYSGLRVAGYLAKLRGAKLVFGSATPPVEEYFYAVNKGAQIHRITEIPNKSKVKNNVFVVDLSTKSEQSKHPLLSTTLLQHIDHSLQSKRQILLFLNKRGSSRLMLCQNCGWYAVCNRCNIPYTYHHDSHQLVCHLCGNSETAPNNCPDCKSTDLLFKNPGTKAIEEAISHIFPNAKIGRYDKDNKKIESFSANHAAISAGKIDILIGTQLLTKGHDLPRLGLVGILLAESSLQFPDYNSAEKSFQQLHQIAGRVGRRGTPGTIIVQTYDPKSKFLEYVKRAEDDWIQFYTTELQQRRMFKFPPFTNLMKIEVSRKSDQTAEKFATNLTNTLRQKFGEDVEILGPSPSFFHKQNNAYFWQIIIKSPARSKLLEIISELPKSCTYDIDPTSLL